MNQAKRPALKPARRIRSPKASLSPETYQGLDPKEVSEMLLKCIGSGDMSAFRSVLADHIEKSNKLRLAKKTGLTRRTIYDVMNPAVNFNPALSTVCALIRGLSE